jgi:hypothetical protein
MEAVQHKQMDGQNNWTGLKNQKKKMKKKIEMKKKNKKERRKEEASPPHKSSFFFLGFLITSIFEWHTNCKVVILILLANVTHVT